MVTDRIGDFIIRLKNAAMIGRREVSVPYSKFLFEIATKLKQLGFISSVEVVTKEGSAKRSIMVELAYSATGTPRLRDVKRISKPGRRLYTPYRTAHTVRHGRGARLLTTSQGVLSDVEARKAQVGGEELFEIW